MRPIVVSVGPLATATATKVAAAQRNYGVGGALALNGAASDAVATTVAASQSPGSAALTINGTRATGGVAYLGQGKYVYITSAGNDSGITWSVVGTVGLGNIVVRSTVAGTNAQVSATPVPYKTIISITPSGAVASSVTVGSYTKATLDVARRLLFTTTADESANIATITGTDWAGGPITENLTLVSGSTVASVLDYKTVEKVTMSAAAAGNISIGTNGVAASQWVRLDGWAPSYTSIQCNVSGTVNYTVQTSLDDPNNLIAPVSPGSMVWINTSDTSVVAATTSQQSNFLFMPLWARVLLNSGTGSVTATFQQSSNGPV